MVTTSVNHVDTGDTERTTLLRREVSSRAVHEPIDGEVFTATDARGIH